MPEIDLEPKNYRASPLKGEPIAQEDGLPRFMMWLAWLGLSIFVAALLRNPSSWLSDWLTTLWH